ncbi:ABC transporter substrate-binding protein [Phytoactinopolyspora sp. XMNu-373]|uniref:ABC transporter substrate-binding protein n=2 Tax=Phytoactinopolyspora mesophila TaxID=2650750 RepID=A0A7K3M7A9_9ACTN|nr:ABC transporter substrate-binding protein [Phytoactinopolyspora mesophila]
MLLAAGCGSSVSDGNDDASTAGDENSVENGNDDEDATGTAMTITNCGRELTVEDAPNAAVGLSPSQTELLIRLGLGDRLVGQAQTSTAPLPEDIQAEAADVAVLSDEAPPTREILLGAEPDFVYAPTSYEFTAEQGFASLEQLEEADTIAYIATGGCFDRRMEAVVEDLFTDLENMGAIFGVEEAAQGMIEDAQAILDDVAARIDGLERPSVAQVYVEGNTLTAIGAGVEYDIIRKAGGDNVFGPDDDAFADFFAAQINPEVLANADPEALVFAVNDDGHEQSTRDYLESTFPDMTAVTEGRMIAISGADAYPGTLGNVNVVQQIAEGLYPDAF